MNSSASNSILTVGKFVIQAYFTNHFEFSISDKNCLFPRKFYVILSMKNRNFAVQLGDPEKSL